jgi:DNA-binding CsgD family transcriptional regulator/type II secretory pathway predicted ATPase ExeA
LPARTTPLLERDHELAALAAAARSARAGEGRMVVVEGPAGIGKTTMLRSARAAMEHAGLVALTARGIELEREFAFGAVRQLLERAARDGVPALFDGPAALAAPLLGAEVPPGAPAPPTSNEASYAVLHGLYWLTVHLARRQPLALIVDDAHWLDASSLRYLAYLGARLEGTAAIVVLATRRGEPGASPLLAELTQPDETLVLRLAPFSASASEELVRAALPHAEPQLARALHAATTGNPLFLRQLLEALAEAGPAQSGDVLQRTPAGVRAAVAARIARLPPAARALAQAVAVLGTDVLLRHAAALARLDAEAAGLAADQLSDAALLEPGRPLRFVHPIVRSALLDDLAPGSLSSAHAGAAHLLAADRAPAERVAAHLLAVEPRSDAWLCRTLVEAARHALERGAPEAAVTYLHRALHEPPPEDERPAILIELGHAEALTFQPAPAIDHLRRGIAESGDPDARVRAALMVGVLLASTATADAGVRFMAQTLDETPHADPRLLAQLEGHMAAFARSNAEAWSHVAGRLAERLREMQEGGSGAPAGLATAAADLAMVGAPSERVVEAARRALAAGREIGSPGDFTVAMASRCLIIADELDEADAALDAEIATLRERGGQLLALPLRVFRAESLRRRGRLAAAEQVGRQAVADAPGWRVGMPAALGVLALVLVQRGGGEEAVALLRDHGLTLPASELPDDYQVTMALHARGVARLAAGDLDGAADDLLTCGARLAEIGEVHPGALAWRSPAARALAARGEERAARALAAEELVLARAAGAPRAISIALRAVAAIEPGASALPALREAVAVTADSPAVLEHGHALADLGAMLVDAGRPDEAREFLEGALDVAHDCDATPLQRRVVTALARTGRRPRRPRTGPAALTRAEQRVARLAAAGAPNREIADRLVVTTRTVEFHLTNVYRKLGIGSRGELATTLAATGLDPGGE